MMRLERNAVVAVGVFAALALLWRPRAPLFALGIVGGGVLIGVSYWAIRGLVDAVASTAVSPQIRPKTRMFALVKFFTRHAILALAGYGMMTRLHLDPIGLLIGVSAPLAALAIEAAGGFKGSRVQKFKGSGFKCTHVEDSK
jgi:hypothetical protein